MGVSGIAVQIDFSGPDLTNKICGPIRVCLHVMSGDMDLLNAWKSVQSRECRPTQP